jgi:ABC-type sugar transport system ATPase subunit
MNHAVFLEFNHITKRYGDHTALEDVSFSIRCGEIHGILGENGSGKTTLLQMIGGLATAEEGEMSLCGCRYSPRSPADANANGIYGIYIEPGLMDNLCVAENTMKGMYPRKGILKVIDWNKLNAQCEELYRSLNLDIDIHAPAHALSLREKRLVELVRAYFFKAKLVIIDEPDFSPDEKNYNAVVYMINKITERGGAVAIATHRIEDILRISDRVTIMENGRVRYSGESSLTNRRHILRLMAGGESDFKDIYPKMKEFSGRPVLELRQVSTKNGLLKTDLSIHKGEILGISSLTAQLRSALARAIYGLDDLTEGGIFLNGERIRIGNPGDAVRSGIGFLSEDRVQWGLQNEFPIPHNISLSNLKEIGLLGLLRFKKEEKEARSYVRKFNIKMDSFLEKVSHLSTGNQQKVLLSRWLFSNCRILMLEEPTKNIDKSSKIEIYNFMNSFVQRGGTIIFISSHIEELIGMCDRIAVFSTNGMYGIINREEFNKESIIEKGL